jgi:hypothetical protein
MRNLSTTVRLMKFRLGNKSKHNFNCPVCGYEEPFDDVNPATGFRKHAQCPSCGAWHRIQYLVIDKLLKGVDPARLRKGRQEQHIKEIAIQVIKKTPLYHPLRNWVVRRKQIADLAEWQRKGRPIPLPHMAKQRILREYAQRYGLRVLVETGTYFGDMVEAMKANFDRIYSVELSRDLHEKAMIRFKGIHNIELIHGDSSIELERIMAKINQPTLFWLDGHWSGGVTARGAKDTPVHDELRHILNAADRGHVIIIDDARCFGTDPGYRSIEELSEFIKSKRSNLDITVQDDSIRITPKQRDRGSPGFMEKNRSAD